MFQSVRTYRKGGGIDFARRAVYVCTQRFTPNAAIQENAYEQSLYFRAEIKTSEIRKVFDRWQKWFHGIVLLGTGKQMHGSI